MVATIASGSAGLPQVFQFRVASCTGYVSCMVDENGELIDIKGTVASVPSPARELFEAILSSVSIGLKAGVPLGVYVVEYKDARFEPAGRTDDQRVPLVGSILDYVFRRLALDYISLEGRIALRVLTTEEQMRLGTEFRESPGIAPACLVCNIRMVRAGTVHVCPSCGATSEGS